MATMTCHFCAADYREDDNLVLAWADSGDPFEPTDWECHDCRFEPSDYHLHQILIDNDRHLELLIEALQFAPEIYRALSPNIP